MILPLVLALSFFSQVSTCRDLSGQYVMQGSDNRVYVSIAQARCERIVITWEKFDKDPVQHRLVLDGRYHQDPRWFERGGPPQQTSATLKGATLEIEMQLGDAADYFALRLTLLSDGDLCIADSRVAEQASRAARQRTPNQTGQDDAAERSRQSCSVR